MDGGGADCSSRCHQRRLSTWTVERFLTPLLLFFYFYYFFFFRRKFRSSTEYGKQRSKFEEWSDKSQCECRDKGRPCSSSPQSSCQSVSAASPSRTVAGPRRRSPAAGPIRATRPRGPWCRGCLSVARLPAGAWLCRDAPSTPQRPARACPTSSPPYLPSSVSAAASSLLRPFDLSHKHKPIKPLFSFISFLYSHDCSLLPGKRTLLSSLFPN